MRKLKNNFRWRNILLVALLIKLIYWLFRWCIPSGKKGFKIDDKLEAKAIPGQLIIMRKKDITPEQFDQWKKEALRAPGIRYKKVCGNCDNMLELWEGDERNIRTFIQGVEKLSSGGQSHGSGSVEGGGETPFAYFCLNFTVHTPDRFLEPCIRNQYKYDEQRIVPPEPAGGALVTIGVLDTGLNDSAKNAYTKPVTGSCIPGGDKGWNFILDSNDTTDDNDSRHGSLVTEFIIGQARKYNKQPVNILPVKVHNNEGNSTLFDILCAVAYASSCGVQIINASFGFYANQKSDAPSLLRAFIEHYLVAKNILLIAAAGNINAVEDKDFLEHAPRPAGHPRDLDVHPFYPACFAKEFEQVLAVTTVQITEKTASSSPEQNFSSHVVDMGVECDKVDAFGHYSFYHPFKPQQMLIYGTSYAAPILTGIISQHYTELLGAMPGGQFDKQLLLQKLQSLLLTKTTPKLTHFVKDGISCKKDIPL